MKRKPSPDHKKLMSVLKKMSAVEQWRKLPKYKGTVVESSLTKTGNIKITLKQGKEERVFFVLKRNKNLFAEAEKLREGDYVSVAVRKHLLREYAVKIVRSKDERLDRWS